MSRQTVRAHGLVGGPSPRHARAARSYPDVQLGAFVRLPLEDLRGCVRGAPTPRGQWLSRLVEIPKSEV